MNILVFACASVEDSGEGRELKWPAAEEDFSKVSFYEKDRNVWSVCFV